MTEGYQPKDSNVGEPPQGGSGVDPFEDITKALIFVANQTGVTVDAFSKKSYEYLNKQNAEFPSVRVIIKMIQDE
jgi:hypothetical protein